MNKMVAGRADDKDILLAFLRMRIFYLRFRQDTVQLKQREGCVLPAEFACGFKCSLDLFFFLKRNSLTPRFCHDMTPLVDRAVSCDRLNKFS